jgi:hypothetical protein
MNVANVVFHAQVSPSRIISCHLDGFHKWSSNSLFPQVKSGFLSVGTSAGL